MDAVLEKHGAKHVYRIPDGLRELCNDVSREVLRSQPQNIYRYIADYAEALVTTRENARAAVRVVNSIVVGSEAIASILRSTGLSLGQMAVAAPRLQRAFEEFLRAVEDRGGSGEDEYEEDCSEESRVSVLNILESTGAESGRAERAATLIQGAFRGHYERMLEREANGHAEWEKRVAESTTEILERAGVSRSEAEHAATVIQSAYRGYYARRGARTRREDEEPKGAEDEWGEEEEADSRRTIGAVAWLNAMYEDSGVEARRANEAATLIQRVYRGYECRRRLREAKLATRSSPRVTEEAALDAGERLSRGSGEREQRVVGAVAEEIEKTRGEEGLGESASSSQTKLDGIYEDSAAVKDATIEPE